MAIIVQGNLFDADADAICVTCNNQLTKQGSLVMGAGAAREMLKYFPKAAQTAGEVIGKVREHSKSDFYGFLLTLDTDHDRLLGFLQTKYHWRDPSPLELVERSLIVFALSADRHPDISFACNMPGIGLGGLAREVVVPLVNSLPENITFYERG